MRYSRGIAGPALLLTSGCASPPPEVTSSGPETGPYGTVVTVEGRSLALTNARIEFESGYAVALERVSDTSLSFRVPSPAYGAFRLVGDDGSLSAGHFEPDPWRPRPLSEVGSDDALLDFAVLGSGSTAELRREDQALVAHFHDPGADEPATVTVPGAGQPSAGVVWSDSPALLSAFVLERSPDSDPILRALEIDRAGANQVSLELPEDATELLGFDRESDRRFAFVADTDEDEVLKYEWTASGLEETWTTADPALPSSTKKKFLARNGHAWRVWVESIQTIIDVTFRVHAAYLAPGATQFQPALDLGGGDDSSSNFDVLGVTDSGELALEFCAVDSDISLRTVVRCTSIAAGPQGTIVSSADVSGVPRTLHLALSDGLYEFRCEDDVHVLYASGAPSGPAYGDPVLSPCVDHLPAYRLAPDGNPAFFFSSVVLARD